ncbi:MAG: ion channel [Ignavibacteriaceae bacterium]|nr:ion channel [Ignavibacteriaceae bacterium]
MSKQAIDPGLGEKFGGKTKRIINPDGSFNVRRRNTGYSPRDIYHFLVNLSWTKFFLLILAGYFLVNLIFGTVYYAIGVENLRNAIDKSPMQSYLNAYFFSVQTFTTVGYGGMVPSGLPANFVASIEALVGLLGFAIATGLLYGRFSRPSTRILFSRNAVVSPYHDKTALMFRLANQRNNDIIEVEANVLAVFIDKDTNNRKYFGMNLERNSVYFFPLSWTVVHPIDELSPFYNKTLDELKELKTEILIQFKGFDDTFSQTVHTKYSYSLDEIIWNAKFKPAFEPDPKGEIIFDLNRIHDYEVI